MRGRPGRPFNARPSGRAGPRPATAGRRAVRRNSAGCHAGRGGRWTAGQRPGRCRRRHSAGACGRQERTGRVAPCFSGGHAGFAGAGSSDWRPVPAKRSKYPRRAGQAGMFVDGSELVDEISKPRTSARSLSMDDCGYRAVHGQHRQVHGDRPSRDRGTDRPGSPVPRRKTRFPACFYSTAS